ncbi:MAG: hypothetical protein CVU78_01210 [Elusimicrobia bacterium HGW-Elusimicrobia-2]|nr:MAG: hypothetical protein CVU78_01210 [Elusimicrobia bacterium HGW-Elusimicrobia-2]
MIDEISFIIPVFNERETLPDLLKSLGVLLVGVAKSEIIVINDGSTDGSERLVPDSVKLVNSVKQCGYGASIKKGLRKAEYSKICIIDADGTYPPEAVRTLLENYRGEDMLVGKRENIDLSPLRRPVKWIINKFAGFLTGEKIPDLNSGLRIFKKAKAMQFFSYFPDGFSFTTTITAAFLTNGMTVNYEIIPYLKRSGKSSFRPIADTKNMILLIIRNTLYFNPLKVLLPLGVFFAIIAAVVFGVSWKMGEILDATVSVLVSVAVQIFVLAFIADVVKQNKN